MNRSLECIREYTLEYNELDWFGTVKTHCMSGEQWVAVATAKVAASSSNTELKLADTHVELTSLCFRL